MERNRYSPKLKVKAINMYSASATISQISRALGVSEETIRSWVSGPRVKGSDHETPSSVRNKIERMSEREITAAVRQGIGGSMKLTSELLARALRERATDKTPASIARDSQLAFIANRNYSPTLKTIWKKVAQVLKVEIRDLLS